MRPVRAHGSLYRLAVVLAVMFAQAAAGSTLDGLVGYWPLDEGQGDQVTNVVGERGNLFGSTGNGTLRQATWGTGKLGGALHFSKGGRGVLIGQMRELECDQAVTVAAWVSLEDAQQTGFVLNRERGYRLGLDPQGRGQVRFQLALDGKWAGNWLLSRSRLQPGRWYHLAAVYDGTQRRIYLDGQLDAGAPATGTISRGDLVTVGQDFSGLIDEVRVWNRALSQEELARAMAEDASQVRAVLRPADALRFYPVRGVGMLGQGERAEVAVFNSGETPFAVSASVALLSSKGAAVAQGTPQLSVGPRGVVRVGLGYHAGEPGMYSLVLRADGRDLYRMPVYVLAPHARRPQGELKLERVASVDLTQNLGPEQLCEDGSSRVVDAPVGRYREAGGQRGSRFVVRLTLRRPGLHLLRVRYPDDKARTCEVVACSPKEADLYNAQTGYLTGVTSPLSNRVETLDCVLWARDPRQSVIFTTRETGRPAAAVSVEAYEVDGGLPSSPVAGAGNARQIGLYWEDAAPLPWCVGAEGPGFEAFDHAICNLCDLMDYTGENVLFHPAVWYNGPIYSSLVEESGTLGGRDMPAAGWMDILLRRFEERGFRFYPTLNVHELPSLVATGNADAQSVQAGEPTFNAVTRDGRVTGRTWHNQPPAYNALHPRVQERVLALVQELAERHAQSPAFGGIAFHLTRCQLLQLGGLDVGYDDWTLAEFERDTGLKVPVDSRDPQRFGKRYDWLLAQAREQWIHWRCARLASYYGQVAQVLRSKRPDLRLVAVVLHPIPAVHADLRKRWEQGTRLADLSREAGIDPTLLGQKPGVAFVKHLGPPDYRFCLANSQPGSEQALLSVRQMDFCDDQLREYRPTADCGVFLYNRYFESAGNRQNPLACGWYQDPSWLASAIVPGGDGFMEYYAHSMAALDPEIVVTGGFTVGTVGHEAQVERFARVFRQLPVGSWTELAGLQDKVVGRTCEVKGKRYLYVVNASPVETQVSLPLSAVGAQVQQLGGSPALLRTEGGWSVRLGPFELAAWMTEATRS
ncbi:MAG: LamG domain-containing protein [Armatimonadia bacterium]